MARYAAMRYRRAVEKLRILAETCERVKLSWFDTAPFLKAVYAFGEVLDGADPPDAVQVAVAINLRPEEVPWESTPERADWLADEAFRTCPPISGSGVSSRVAESRSWDGRCTIS
jgi:hypothetical protein